MKVNKILMFLVVGLVLSSSGYAIVISTFNPSAVTYVDKHFPAAGSNKSTYITIEKNRYVHEASFILESRGNLLAPRNKGSQLNIMNESFLVQDPGVVTLADDCFYNWTIGENTTCTFGGEGHMGIGGNSMSFDASAMSNVTIPLSNRVRVIHHWSFAYWWDVRNYPCSGGGGITHEMLYYNWSSSSWITFVSGFDCSTTTSGGPTYKTYDDELNSDFISPGGVIKSNVSIVVKDTSVGSGQGGDLSHDGLDFSLLVSYLALARNHYNLSKYNNVSVDVGINGQDGNITGPFSSANKNYKIINISRTTFNLNPFVNRNVTVNITSGSAGTVRIKGLAVTSFCFPFIGDWNTTISSVFSCSRETIRMNGTSNFFGNITLNNSYFTALTSARKINLRNNSKVIIVNSTINGTSHNINISVLNVSQLIVNDSKLIKTNIVTTPQATKRLNRVNILKTSFMSRTPSSNITFTKNITNSTIVASRVNTTNIKNCVILDSTFRATQGCLNAFIDPSFIYNSTTDGSTIRNSTINNSILTNSIVLKVNISDSNINASNINSSVLTNVNGSFLRIINSTLANINLPRGANITNNQFLQDTVVSYGLTFQFTNGAVATAVNVQVINSTGQTTFSHVSSGNYLLTNVTFSPSNNRSTINLPDFTPTPGFIPYVFSLQSSASGIVTIVYANSAGGGGAASPPNIDISNIETFSALIMLSPEALSSLTTSQLTQLIDGLSLTTSEVIQVFARMALAQQQQIVADLTASGGAAGGSSVSAETLQAMQDYINKQTLNATNARLGPQPVDLVKAFQDNPLLQYGALALVVAVVIFTGKTKKPVKKKFR